MLDIKLLRENPKEIEAGIRKKGSQVDVGAILKLDDERRKLIQELDALRAEQNKASGEVPKLSGSEKEMALDKLKKLKAQISELEPKAKQLEEEFDLAMFSLPNPPLPSVPEGRDERDNKVLREEGKKPKFDFTPKDYLSLAENLGLIDIENAGKISGSRFGYLKGDAAKLEVALLSLGMKVLTDQKTLAGIAKKAGLKVSNAPFMLVIPPVMVRPEILGRMGYLKKRKSGWENEEVYFLRDDELVLVGTSEQSVGPMHMDEVFEEAELPRRYLGFSTCFRREAGSYGKDTKGILRVHQFDKLEMFSFSKSEDSVEEHKFLLACEEYLMQQLRIPYRVVALCAGDLAAPSASTLDIESWMPGQPSASSDQGDGSRGLNRLAFGESIARSNLPGKFDLGQYRETHSTSNTTDFQARRLNIKYRTAESKTEFVHMLNGTAFAMGRMIISIIENYQTKDGKFRVPEVLQDYVGKKIIG